VTPNITQQIDTLLNAFESDEDVYLLTQALSESAREVREVAYWLLTETTKASAKQALRDYLPYAEMQCLHTIVGSSEREPNYFAISMGRKSLLSNCHNPEIKGYAYPSINIWNLQTGKLTHTLSFPHEHVGTGQDGTIIAGHFQHIIEVLKSWETKHPLVLHPSSSDEHQSNSDIGSLVMSYDGAIVACGELGSTPLGLIAVWDVRAERIIHSLQWKPNRVFSNTSKLMISPNGSLLLSQAHTHIAPSDQDLHRLWNLQTGEMICEFETSRYWVADAIATTPTGKCIVSGVRENSVKVWDVMTDQVTHSFLGCSPTAMTPDGRVLAYSNDVNAIVLWDLDVNQKISSLPGNTSPVKAICLSSDREWVVSYHADDTIKIYGLSDE
jgi:WD40 repeat protein